MSRSMLSAGLLAIFFLAVAQAGFALNPQPPVSLVPYLGSGPGPDGLASADMNGDGRDDIVMVNTADQTITVLLGQADGSLDVAPGSPVPASPAIGPRSEFDPPRTLGPAIAELNGDTHLDVVVTRTIDDGDDIATVVLFGDGQGGFSNAPGTVVDTETGVMPMPDDRARPVAIGDVDGDGEQDIVIANVGGTGVRVLLGDGAGSFAPAAGAVDLGGQVGVIRTADLDGNGRDDLVTQTNFDNFTSFGVLEVLLDDGVGGFNAPVEIYGAALVLSRQPVIVDINGDQALDVGVFTDFGAPPGVPSALVVTFLLNDGAGSFTGFDDSLEIDVGTGPAQFGEGFNVTDSDGDGNLDIVLSFGLFLEVARGDGAGNFADPVEAGRLAAGGFGPLVPDLDGDGNPDLVVFDRDQLNLILGNDEGRFEPGTTATVTFASNASGTFGDFDGDGAVDVLVDTASLFGEPTRDRLLQGLDNGRFRARASREVLPGTPADLNGDGADDLVRLLTFSENAVEVYFSDGSAGFPDDPDLQLMLQDRPVGITISDVSGDGSPDLVVPTTPDVLGGRELQVVTFLGNGAGEFTPAAATAMVDGSPEVPTLGELTGDGNGDLVTRDTVDFINVVLRVYAGDGAGAFAEIAASPLTAPQDDQFQRREPILISTANVDGSGLDDILAITRRGPFGSEEGAVYELVVFLADGAGGFEIPMGGIVPLPARPDAIFAADFIGDASVDVLLTRPGTDEDVDLLLGAGDGTFAASATGPLTLTSDAEKKRGSTTRDVDGDDKPDLTVITNGRQGEFLHVFTSNVLFSDGGFETRR